MITVCVVIGKILVKKKKNKYKKFYIQYQDKVFKMNVIK